jgi:uncharacterized protein
MTDHSQYRLRDGMVLDARRAVWLEDERVLAVSDLHLGYAWAQRHRGALLPITSADDTIDRLGALCLQYRAPRLVLLGDIVHRALPLPEIERAVAQLVDATAGLSVRADWILGNHDRNLEKLLRKMRIEQAVQTELQIGKFRFAHGDVREALHPRPGEWLVVGHEHPAISLGDGVASHMKCPCFLVGENVLMLPAFSRWAAGTNIHSAQWSCPMEFSQAVAVCDDKLLRVPL